MVISRKISSGLSSQSIDGTVSHRPHSSHKEGHLSRGKSGEETFQKIDVRMSQSLSGVKMRHKFAGQIKCDLSIGTGGTGDR